MHSSITRLFVLVFILTGISFGIAQAQNQTVTLYAASLVNANPQDKLTKDEENIYSSKKIRIINLGPVVNSLGDDFAPTISADGKTLYFVSDRPGSKKYRDTDLFSQDFWATTKQHRLDTVFTKPFNIDTTTNLGMLGVNTIDHEGAASISADKQTLYFTACGRPDGLGKCDIYKTTIQGDKWARPINLGRNVNSEYWESSPSISPDQKRLYFISNRPKPGTKSNDLNIWYSDLDEELEEFKPAQFLDEINTEEKEFSPFIAADGVTLFFASNGHKPLVGGTDFFYSKYDTDTKHWSKPVNLGEPINTKEDEYYISLPASGDVIYFSSKRTDLEGYQAKLDLFMAFVPTFFRAINFKAVAIDECSGDNIPANIVVKNLLTGRVFKDSVTATRKEIEMVINYNDFGNPKDSIQTATFEVVASNPKYGSVTRTQVVTRPPVTTNQDELKTFASEIKVTVPLGQKPTLASKIATAKYAEENKQKFPELAQYNGLIMRQKLTWNLYPLLNYVFFDLGSSDIPERYILFKDNAETKDFADTTITGGTLDKYYHLLNIYGYRLTKNPSSKIEIVGCNDGTTSEEKRSGLSKERANNVYNYLRDVWQIDESRMKLTYRDKPQVVSNLKDSLGITENRRVEIVCSEWEIMKPVFDVNVTTYPDPANMNFVMKNGIEDALVTKRRIEISRNAQPWNTLTEIGTIDQTTPWDWKNTKNKFPQDEGAQSELKDLPSYSAKIIVTTSTGRECESDPIVIPVKFARINDRIIAEGKDSTDETYNLVLFPFDRADAGPINERIMRDYVYERCMPTSAIEVIGHTDVVGLYERNMKLSTDRANTVTKGINKSTSGTYGKLDSKGVGEDEALYTNMLPEGRFYNRTVQVRIKTPLKDLKK